MSALSGDLLADLTTFGVFEISFLILYLLEPSRLPSLAVL